MRLEKKVAVVTGGTRGLGAALVDRFLLEGCQVISCARNPSENTRDSKRHLFVQADCSREEEVERFMAEVREHCESVDFVINNVGYGGSLQNSWEIPSEEFQTHWANNLMAAVWMTQRILPSMLERGQGTLVFVASQAAKRAVPRVSAYCASKFALVGFAQALAKEISDSGVRSLTICPAGMDTPMRESLFHDASKQQSPDAVARVIMDILCGMPDLANGAEVIIRGEGIVHVEGSRTF